MFSVEAQVTAKDVSQLSELPQAKNNPGVLPGSRTRPVHDLSGDFSHNNSLSPIPTLHPSCIDSYEVVSDNNDHSEHTECVGKVVQSRV